MLNANKDDNMKNIHRDFLNLPESFEVNEIPKDSSVPSGIITRIKNEVSEIDCGGKVTFYKIIVNILKMLLF